MANVLVLTDTHCPFMHRDAIAFLSAVADQFHPDIIVHNGDVADFHFASRWSKSAHNSGESEVAEAVVQLESLSTLFPRVRVVRGNHDTRIQDRLDDLGLPRHIVRSMNAILGLPVGWKWCDEYEVDGVIYEHGENYSGRDAHLKAARGNLQNTVIGHVHAHAGIQYVECRRRHLWGMNAGCLIDNRAYAFEYAKKHSTPVTGCGMVVDGIPAFLPMMLDGHRRWQDRPRSS
jgi:predicted phosphodiesterase